MPSLYFLFNIQCLAYSQTKFAPRLIDYPENLKNCRYIEQLDNKFFTPSENQENSRTKNNKHKMARIKRHRNTRNHEEMKHCHREPNIPELVYKFLTADEASDDTEYCLASECRCCGQEKHHDEVVDSILRNTGKNISYRVKQRRRKDGSRISKLHNVKRCSISKDLPISYLQECMDSGGTRKARKYIKNALDFGIESGYLIPFDPAYKILRVSPDLIKSDSRRSKISTYDTALSKGYGTRLEDQMQEQRRRRRRRVWRGRGRRSRSDSGTRRRSRRRRRRRSRSRSRGRRRYGSPQNPEEVAEDEADDYEIDENDPKSNIHTDDIEREPKTTRLNQPDEGQSTKKAEENSSDLSIDEDGSDDEDGKKRTDITKS